jgi:hypothetical protein
MPFCASYGNQITGNIRFCPNCGQPAAPAVQPFNNMPPQTVPPPYFASEPVLFIIPNLQQNNALGKRDTFYLVVTQQRSLFIKINELITQKAFQQRQAKSQGQGFIGRWKEQVAGPDTYLEYLRTLTVAGMLGESPESYSIGNAQIQQVGIKFYYSEESPSEWHLDFQTAGGLVKFIATDNPEKLLLSSYPGRVFKKK